MRRMPRLSRHARDVVALMLLLCAFVADGRTQTIVAHGAAGPASLVGPWLLNEGDPPGWPSSPSFLTDTRPGRAYWLQHDPSPIQGPGIIWLRATVSADEAISNPALLVNPNADECQVFVNGQLAADCARWPRTDSSARRWMLVHLPASPVQIAIRIVGGGAEAASLPRSGELLYGSAHVLEDIRTATDAAHLYESLPQTLLCLGELLGGVILLLVFANDRSAREYLWFAAFLFLDGSMSLESVFLGVYPLLPLSFGMLTDALGMFGRYAPLVGFIAAFTGIRLNRWMRGYQILLLTIPVLIGPPYLSEGLSQFRLSVHSYNLLLLSIELPFIAGSLAFLSWKWKHGNREAGLLLPPFVLASTFEVLGLTIPWFRYFHFGRFAVEFDDLSMFFFLVSIGPVMLFRHRRTGLEHARVTGELNAAREIQEQLVTPPPAVPGFTVECIYRPATQVGGDFYRVLPADDGGLLVVVGDVSGKGLPAAMTVSAIVGSLRTISTGAPAELIRTLNQSLAGNLRSGFVTCLAVRLRPDGSCAAANAGHVLPYLNGKELVLDNGLPLGLSSESTYVESAFQLPPGAQLTLLTDGVVEARNAAGDLFGFERTAAISTQSSEEIALAAQHFGQEDDITVLTIQFAPAEVLHA